MSAADESPSKPSQASEPAVTARFESPDAAAAELAAALDRYLGEMQAGRKPDRAAFLAAHPAVAVQLDQCLAGIEFIHLATAPTTDQPQLLGDFRILKEIGRGGMGVVYEAEQRSLGRRVALKVLRYGAASDAEAMQRFEQEAKTVAALHHTNIVPIFAVGCEQGVHYYAMQFIEGRSLASVAHEATSTHKPLAAADVARWGFEAAEALAHAHQRGVIHRDVKPSNLLLDAEGRLWLTDFGLARRIDEVTLTATGALLGTPRYMSPEQATAIQHPVDHRTDIYSLGASLYELAAGRPVFDSDTPQGVFTQILTCEPVPPRKHRTDLPRDLETIILKCLSKEPSQRYSSAQELADDLRWFLAGRTIKARRPNVVERILRWGAKHRRSVAVSALTVAASLVLMIGGTVGWSAYRTSLQGKVALATDDTKLAAEVLAADSNKVVIENFSLPTQQPESIEEGEYRLRLSEPGQLGATYQLLIDRGKEAKADVSLGEQQMTSPLDIDRQYDLLDVGGRHDIIVRTPTGARRVDPRTGAEEWNAKLTAPVFKKDEQPPLPELAGFYWDSLHNLGWNQPDTNMALMQPQIDLNGDGAADLVWLSRAQQAVLAQSGKDGKVLWNAWQKIKPHTRNKEMRREGGVIGQPAQWDVNGDGTLDIIVTWVEHPEPATEQSPPVLKRSVTALSGRTGEELWSHDVDDSLLTGKADVPQDTRWFLRLEVSSTYPLHADDNLYKDNWYFRTGDWLATPLAPLVDRSGKEPRVLVVVGSKLITLDPKTGESQGQPHELGFWPPRQPQLTDLDGDGRHELLLTEQRETELIILQALSLDTHKPLWTAEVKARWRRGMNEQPFDWPLVADLNRDGKLAIVLPIGGFNDPAELAEDPRGARRWAGLTVLNGQTGKPRDGWPRVIARNSGADWNALRQIDSFTTGQDLNGDGVLDIVAGTFIQQPGFLSERQAGRAYVVCLHVDAISGRDGSLLWWKREEIALEHSFEVSQFGQIEWGPPGPDGRPLIVVGYKPLYDPAQKDRPIFMAASTGEVVQTGEDLCDLQLVELDGDGIVDLVAFQRRYRGAMDGKLHLFHGTAPERWRQLLDLTPATDVNGDGTPDFYHSYFSRPRMISGRDGHELWRLDSTANQYLANVAFPPLPYGDLDGDGRPDLLTFSNRKNFSQSRASGSEATKHPLLQAVSGKTGRLIWSAEARGEVAANAGIKVADLDGDGHAEVIAVMTCDLDVTHKQGQLLGGNDWQLWLGVFAGRTGKLLWKQSLGDKNTFGMRWPEDRAGAEPTLADLNGDGVLDVLAPAIIGETDCELRAFNGRDGQLLWKQAMLRRHSRHQLLNELPVPVVGDLDADGQVEVAVLETLLPADVDLGDGKLHGHDQLTVLSGRTGEVRWQWKGNYDSAAWGYPSTRPAIATLYKPIPLLVDLKGDSHKAICIWNSAGKVISLIGPDGKLIEERKSDDKTIRENIQVWSANLDGTPGDELIFGDGNFAWATQRGLSDPLWKYECGGSEIIGLWRSDDKSPLQVVVDQFTMIRGLDGATGKPRWLCDPPNRRNRVGYHPPTILASGEKNGLPIVMFPDVHSSSVARQSLPATADGKFDAAAMQPETSTTTIVHTDLRTLRPLPWLPAQDWWDWRLRVIVYTLPIAAFTMAWLFYPTTDRLRRMLIRAAVFALIWMIVALALDRRQMESTEQYSLVGAPVILVQGLWMEFLWQLIKGLYRMNVQTSRWVRSRVAGGFSS